MPVDGRASEVAFDCTCIHSISFPEMQKQLTAAYGNRRSNSMSNKKVKRLADQWCRSQGLALARFIEDAIIDK
jgi:hypothetical protein